MKSKVRPRLNCDKCGKIMEVENTSSARYTVFVLWKCTCGYQHLEKKHIPLVSSV
ncbi:MAG: hypothetical protein ACYTFG_04450 [Planctomycetota bacterium]